MNVVSILMLPLKCAIRDVMPLLPPKKMESFIAPKPLLFFFDIRFRISSRHLIYENVLKRFSFFFLFLKAV